MKHLALMTLIITINLSGCGGEPVKPEQLKEVVKKVEEAKIAVPKEAEIKKVVEEKLPDVTQQIVPAPVPKNPLTDPENPLYHKVIYFSFDSDVVDNEGRELLTLHAEYLVSNPDLKVVLEGHCDERGTRDYNLALGERRGMTASRMMELLNVAPHQLEVISFGEEKPAMYDSNEAAWRLNRRVEIIYQ